MQHGEAAVMADELAAEAVIDQPGVALRAGKAKTASAAERQRRIAASGQKEQRLLLALERAPPRLGEPRRDEASPRRALAGEINRLDRRQVLAAEPLRQAQPAIAAAPRVHLG